MSAQNILSKLLTTFEIESKLGSAKTSEGDLPVYAIKHGDWVVLGIPHESHVMLFLEIDVEEGARTAIDKLAPEQRAKFLSVFRREMLDGRTGFNIFWKDEKARVGLEKVRLEQKIGLMTFDGPTGQRLLDGIQELVTIAVRARQAFGMTFASMIPAQPPASGSSKDAAHEPMYM